MLSIHHGGMNFRHETFRWVTKFFSSYVIIASFTLCCQCSRIDSLRKSYLAKDVPFAIGNR